MTLATTFADLPRLLLHVATALSPALADAATLTGRLDAALAGLVAATGTPGAAATITQGGRTLWSGAAGLARPDAGAPFTADTLSSIASVTKLMTQTIVLRLAEEGRLDLDAPIAPHVPAGVPAADRVTARQLLAHTAGYPDVERLPGFVAAQADPNHPWTREELFAPIEAPQFEPGSAYDYSNTNYLLLGAVIDATYPGGTSAAFRDYVAAPAGLGNDVVFDRDPAVAARFADGYMTLDGVTTNVNAGALDLGVNTSVWGVLWTDGGVAATAEGLARYGDALYGGRLLNAENTAAEIFCGFEYGGRCWDGTLGAFNGYSAALLHDAEADVTLALVLNGLDLDGFSQLAFMPGLIAAYDDATAPAPVPLPAALPLLGCALAGLGALARRRRR